MSIKLELPKRNFIDYYRGFKGAFAAVVLTYLMIILALLFSINEKSNISLLLLLIIVFILLMTGTLYRTYAQHNRLIESLDKSGTVEFLNTLGFHLAEVKSGLNYEVFFEGQLEESFIKVFISARHGLIWDKHYINLLGQKKESIEARQPDNTKIFEYKNPIRITAGVETRSQLEASLNQFVKEIKESWR